MNDVKLIHSISNMNGLPQKENNQSLASCKYKWKPDFLTNVTPMFKSNHRRCSMTNVFLKISQGNNCAIVSLSIKLTLPCDCF